MSVNSSTKHILNILFLSDNHIFVYRNQMKIHFQKYQFIHNRIAYFTEGIDKLQKTIAYIVNLINQNYSKPTEILIKSQ